MCHSHRSQVYYIAGFACDDFNLVFWAICNIEICDIFHRALVLLVVMFFSKTVALAHLTTNQVIVSVHNSLLIIFYAWLVPCSQHNFCFFTINRLNSCSATHFKANSIACIVNTKETEPTWLFLLLFSSTRTLYYNE